MIKKTLIVAGGLGALSVIFFGRDAVSYVSTSVCKVKDSVTDNVPIDFQIDRARKMVKELVPEIRRNMHVIAKEEVEVERLHGQIAISEGHLDKDRGELIRLRSDLSENKRVYWYGKDGNRRYSAEEVKTDLARRFERYKTSDATLNSLQDILAARQRSLDAARAKLEGMMAAKRELEVQVENLEARLKMVQVAQTASDFNFDDSHLARVKDLVTDIRTRLDVAERLVNAEPQFQDQIILEEPASDDIVEEVAQFFELDRPATATVSSDATL